MSEVPLSGSLLSISKRASPPKHSWDESHVGIAGVTSHGHVHYRGISLIRNNPPPLGPPQAPRHSPTAESQGGAGSCELGTPVVVV